MLREILLFSCLGSLPILAIFIGIKWKVFSKALKFFYGYIVITFFIQEAAFILPYLIKPPNNFWLLHLLTFFEFILLSLFYYHLFIEKKAFQKLIQILLPILSILIILNSIYLEPITFYNSNAKSVTQAIIISYSVYYFYVVSTKEILTDSYHKTIHLINSGILFYFAGSLFIFMFGKLSTLMKGSTWGVFVIFNSFIYVIFLIIVFISLWRVTHMKREELQ